MTVGELARVAGVSASTASEHVAAMDAGGFVRVLRQGRLRLTPAGEELLRQRLDLPQPAPVRAGAR